MEAIVASLNDMEEIYTEERNANDKGQLSKICEIYYCKLRNIIIFCRIAEPIWQIEKCFKDL